MYIYRTSTPAVAANLARRVWFFPFPNKGASNAGKIILRQQRGVCGPHRGSNCLLT